MNEHCSRRAEIVPRDASLSSQWGPNSGPLKPLQCCDVRGCPQLMPGEAPAPRTAQRLIAEDFPVWLVLRLIFRETLAWKTTRISRHPAALPLNRSVPYKFVWCWGGLGALMPFSLGHPGSSSAYRKAVRATCQFIFAVGFSEVLGVMSTVGKFNF